MEKTVLDQDGLNRRLLLQGATGLLGAAASVALAGCNSSEAVAAGSAAEQSGRLPDRTVDFVIVGGGISGLTAARRLAQAGKSVVVLEANDRVGGRTLSHEYAPGKIAEFGGTWLGPTQNRVLALANELGLTIFLQYNTGNAVYYGNGQVSTYSDTSPLGTTPPDPLIVPDLPALLRLDQMAAEVPPDAPWTASQASVWDGQTLATWLRDNTVSPQSSKLLSAAFETITGTEAREISLLSFLHHIVSAGDEKNVGTFERLSNTTDAAQQSKIVEGTQQLSIRMATQLGNSVVLQSPVRRIRQSGGGVTVESDRLNVSAKRVIVAIPPPQAARIEFEPVLPGARNQLQQRMPMGWLLKCVAIYDTPFWRTAGLSGATVSDTGPAKLTYDVSPPDGSSGALLGFVGGDEARAWSARPRADLEAAVINNFVTYFGSQARNYRQFFIQDWGLEPWIGGAPISFSGPGVITGYGPALITPVGNIHWAGTETSPYWHGFMDGAVRAGERAAAEVLAAP